jgi:hypothetical protein
MAIAYQTNSADIYNTGIAGSTHTLSITKPTGLSNGDFLIITIASRESDNTSRRLNSPPELIGFTELTEQSTYDTAAISKAWVYIRQIGVASQEPASYSFKLTYQTAAGTPIIVSVIARFSGVSSYSPLDTYGLYGTTGSGVNVLCPGITTVAPNTMLVLMTYTRGANGSSDTPTSSPASTLIAAKVGTNTVTSCTSINYFSSAAAGATGDYTFTWPAGGVNNGVIVALRSTGFESRAVSVSQLTA